MSFAVGDTVAFLNSTGIGRVLELHGDQVLVEDENGFDNWYQVTELVPHKKIDVGEVPQKDAPKRKSAPAKSIKPSEIIKDLHFAELVDYPKNFTNFEMVQIQLKEARKALDHARKAGIKKVILIHGVGEGRLKEEVHTMLERMDQLRFYDASFAKFGSGATEVELF